MIDRDPGVILSTGEHQERKVSRFTSDFLIDDQERIRLQDLAAAEVDGMNATIEFLRLLNRMGQSFCSPSMEELRQEPAIYLESFKHEDFLEMNSDFHDRELLRVIGTFEAEKYPLGVPTLSTARLELYGIDIPSWKVIISGEPPTELSSDTAFWAFAFLLDLQKPKQAVEVVLVEGDTETYAYEARRIISSELGATRAHS